MAEKIEIAGVTAEEARRIRAFLGNDPLNGFESDRGTVAGECVEVDYEYDSGSGLLVVQPKRLPPHLQDRDGAAAGSALREMIGVARASLGDDPSQCGVYDYVLISILNGTRGPIAYSSQDVSHGSVSVVAQSIAPSPTATLALDCRSIKGSGMGAAGTIELTLADGVTMLSIDYQLYTVDSSAYSVGIRGANQAKYRVSNTGTSPSLDGYTYLKPTTTIVPAS